MGYELHITRKEHWSTEDKAKEISLAEWTDYVRNDKDMKLEKYAETHAAGTDVKIKAEIEGLAVWNKYSNNNPGFNMAWFYFHTGNIEVKNPDYEIIDKMIEIAGLLDARVQGDEGELYNHESQLIKKEEELKSTKPWWKIW